MSTVPTRLHGSVWPTTADGSLIVGVTAFGLYADTHNFNASNLVLDALPTTIENPARQGQKIHLLKYPPIVVTYEAVLQAVHDIWRVDSAAWSQAAATAGIEYARPDSVKVGFVVHLGQMRSYPGYSFEKLANRDGYDRRDLDNKTPQRTAQSSDGIPVEGRFVACPAVLRPDIDVEAVTATVKSALPDTLLRVSTEAGRFSCEYLLYSSLAELHQRALEKRVIFAHVPAKDGPDEIFEGVAVVTALIRTISNLL